MDEKIVAVIPLVRYFVIAERYVTHNTVKEAVRELHCFKALHRNAVVLIQLLGDPAGILARQFGVLDETAGQAYRATFVLNPDAKVVLYEIHDMGIGRNAEELLRKLQAARFVYEHGDQVCPAKWRPGAETLTPSLDLVGML